MQYKSTIGADFLTKEVKVEQNLVSLQLWDTAGQEKFHAMGASFYRNAECCILVCDLTDQKSFESIETWRSEFLAQLNPKDPENFPFVLLGNKCDKENERKVPETKIRQYCDTKNSMPYFETSAKDNVNVDKAFQEVAVRAFKRNSKEDEM
jgi:Ras-related protein Rab-7A